MVQYPDEHWYLELLDADLTAKTLTSDEKSIIIRYSMQEADLQKTCIEKRFGIRTAAEYLAALGYRVEEDDRELMPAFLYLGVIDPDESTVYVNYKLIELVESYVESRIRHSVSGAEFPSGRLREVVCWHELYHAIEECTKGIYTRNVRVPRRFSGLFGYPAAVQAASEIGAIHFSKLMSHLRVSPYLYTQFAAAAVNIELEVDDGH